MTHLSEHVSGQIPHLIMPDTHESSLYIRHGVVNVVGRTTHTGVGTSFHYLAIPQSNGVDKFLFVEAEALSSDRQ